MFKDDNYHPTDCPEFFAEVKAYRNWYWNNEDCPKAGFKFVSKHMRNEFPEWFDTRKKVVAANKVIRASFDKNNWYWNDGMPWMADTTR